MAQRPPFPARMDFSTSVLPARTVATKKIASDASRVSASPLKSLEKIPTAGYGMDSDAVRAQMVHKLSAMGITSAPVLRAMRLVERHRFVDTALVNQAYEATLNR